MREIIFRGKRVDNGEWVYGHFFAPSDGKAYIMHVNALATPKSYEPVWFHDWVEIDPATVGQYTGLNTQDGIKCFEHDVIEYDNSLYFKDNCRPRIEDIKRIQVTMSADLGVNGRAIECDIYGCGMVVHNFLANGGKVIGNVHDNPEFVKGGDE